MKRVLDGWRLGQGIFLEWGIRSIEILRMSEYARETTKNQRERVCERKH
jgi:hypothetical protein